MDRPDLDEHSDETLAAAARAGDVRAFETLLVRHEGRVLRILRLMGVRAADREDVAQEVFVRVFRHLGGFRPGRSFSGWLYRITVNASHDHRARAARRGREEAPWDEAFEAATADVRPDPGEELAGQESWRRLEHALARVSERERAVFVLCELEGLETREVARALGITSITVRRHLGRARRRLQELLETGHGKKIGFD